MDPKKSTLESQSKQKCVCMALENSFSFILFYGYGKGIMCDLRHKKYVIAILDKPKWREYTCFIDVCAPFSLLLKD